MHDARIMPIEDDAVNRDRRTANLLGALAGVVRERAEPPKGHPNETDTATAALKLVDELPGVSNRALSEALGLSHPATVRLLDRLEAAGLVERRPGTDRRAVALHVTAAGRRRVHAVLDERLDGLHALVEVLSPEQRRQLDAIAETLLAHAVATPVGAAHVCRLCATAACPQDRCPVHLRAHELLGATGR